MFVFLAALFIAILMIPLTRRLAFRTGRISQPRQDRWSTKPTPYLGGIAIFCAFSIALLTNTPSEKVPLTLLLGGSLAFLVGLVDDFRTLNPAAKMIGILISSSIMVFGGYSTAFFSSQIANVIITLIWIVGITNAFNLLDNMDGLAAGTTLVVSIFLSLLFYRSGNMQLLSVMLALGGSVLGFWLFNFPPASIYMGDSGSLFIGTMLATVSIAREPQASNVFAVVAVPALIFMLPILDTLLVSITRILRGQSPVEGGRDHTSHRLVLLGLSQRQSLLVLLGIAVVSGITSYLVEELSYTLSLFILPLVVVFLAMVSGYLAQVKITSVASEHPVRSFSNPEKSKKLILGRRVFEVSLDFFLVLLAAFWADSVSNYHLTNEIVDFLPITLAISFVIFFVFGIYRFLWRYISLAEMVRILMASVLSSLVSLAVFTFLHPQQEVDLAYFGAFGLFLFALLAATRTSFRFIGMLFRHVRRAEKIPVLIFGAGDAGYLVLRECSGNENLGYSVVGFIDDDPTKQGNIINGVPVLGNVNQLERIVKERQVRGIIIAIGTPLESTNLNKILEVARTQDAWVRRFSLQLELL